ncbi:MAG: hypothetical protein HY769_05290 [Candidatus Stahlbacteria bacterium]|nr:hypothetical protein [Candidatus Stahlbacteria bacterium]
MANFIILSFIVSWIGGGMGNIEKEVVEKSLPFSSKNKLNVSTPNGGIDIYSWDKTELKMEATKKVKGHSVEKSKNLLNKIKINISEDEKGVSIKAELPNKRGDFGVDYKIYIPREAI